MSNTRSYTTYRGSLALDPSLFTAVCILPDLQQRIYDRVSENSVEMREITLARAIVNCNFNA